MNKWGACFPTYTRHYSCAVVSGYWGLRVRMEANREQMIYAAMSLPAAYISDVATHRFCYLSISLFTPGPSLIFGMGLKPL